MSLNMSQFKTTNDDQLYHIFTGKTHYLCGNFSISLAGCNSHYQRVIAIAATAMTIFFYSYSYSPWFTTQLIGFCGKNYRKIPWSSWENLIGFRLRFSLFCQPIDWMYENSSEMIPLRRKSVWISSGIQREFDGISTCPDVSSKNMKNTHY